MEIIRFVVVTVRLILQIIFGMGFALVYGWATLPMFTGLEFDEWGFILFTTAWFTFLIGVLAWITKTIQNIVRMRDEIPMTGGEAVDGIVYGMVGQNKKRKIWYDE